MRYVQTNNGSFIQHILNDFDAVQWDADNKCSVRKLTEAQKTAFGVSKLKLLTPPAFNPASQARTEGDAALIDGAWTQAWEVTDLAGDDLAEAQAKAADNVKKIANDTFDAKAKVIKSDTPEYEVASWTEQKQEAEAWTADNNAETWLLDSIINRTKEDKQVLVTKILTKSKAYKQALGDAIGERQS